MLGAGSELFWGEKYLITRAFWYSQGGGGRILTTTTFRDGRYFAELEKRSQMSSMKGKTMMSFRGHI